MFIRLLLIHPYIFSYGFQHLGILAFLSITLLVAGVLGYIFISEVSNIKHGQINRKSAYQELFVMHAILEF